MLRQKRGWIGLVAAALLAPCARLPAAFDASGWILDWLIFGPLSYSGGGEPPPQVQRLDYLTDGAGAYESTILPLEGLELRPDFGGNSAASGFHPILGEGVEAAEWLHLDASSLRHTLLRVLRRRRRAAHHGGRGLCRGLPPEPDLAAHRGRPGARKRRLDPGEAR